MSAVFQRKPPDQWSKVLSSYFVTLGIKAYRRNFQKEAKKKHLNIMMISVHSSYWRTPGSLKWFKFASCTVTNDINLELLIHRDPRIDNPLQSFALASCCRMEPTVPRTRRPPPNLRYERSQPPRLVFRIHRSTAGLLSHRSSILRLTSSHNRPVG